MKGIIRSALIALTVFTVTAASAQWPNRPVRVINPFPAGGGVDTFARPIAAKLSLALGQSFYVENMGGAGGTVGAAAAAKAPADGYTIFMGAIHHSIAESMYAKLPYNIEKDFQPIALIVHGHLMLAVSPKSDIKSVKELIEKAKASPGKLTNASSSNGSPGHVGGELFKFMTGTQIQHVPYRGGAPAINALVAGHVDLMFESLNGISSAAKSGQVRGLAVSGDKRSLAFPDLPTIDEAGVKGYSAPTWTSLVGPAGLPQPIVEKLNAAVNRAIRSEGFKTRFAAIGDEPAGGTPKDLADTIARDSAKWKSVVERSGAKLD